MKTHNVLHPKFYPTENKNYIRQAYQPSYYRRTLAPSTQLRPTTLLNDSKADDCSLSVIGFDKLVDPSYCKTGKVFWFLVLTSCTAVCVYLITDHVKRYYMHPIAQDVSFFTHENITFPAITVCPTIAHYILQEMGSRISNNDDVARTANIDRWERTLQTLDITIYEYWHWLSLTSEGLTVHIPCDSMSSDCSPAVGKSITVQKRAVSTIWGSCLEIAFNDPQPFRGPFTFIKLQVDVLKSMAAIIGKKVQNTSLGQRVIQDLETVHHPSQSGLSEEKFGVMFYFHEEFNKTCQYAAFSEMQSVFRGYLSQVYLTKKQFQFLATHKHPCDSKESVTECWNACTDREINNVVNCRMPYMTSNTLLPCKTAMDGYKTYKASYDVFSKTSRRLCGCPRTCNTAEYGVSVDRIQRAITMNSTVDLTIIFADNTEESVTEFYSYDLPMLFCDIGGVLGLFMGVCLLTVVETMEAINGLMKRCCKHHKN